MLHQKKRGNSEPISVPVDRSKYIVPILDNNKENVSSEDVEILSISDEDLLRDAESENEELGDSISSAKCSGGVKTGHQKSMHLEHTPVNTSRINPKSVLDFAAKNAEVLKTKFLSAKKPVESAHDVGAINDSDINVDDDNEDDIRCGNDDLALPVSNDDVNADNDGDAASDLIPCSNEDGGTVSSHEDKENNINNADNNADSAGDGDNDDISSQNDDGDIASDDDDDHDVDDDDDQPARQGFVQILHYNN